MRKAGLKSSLYHIPAELKKALVYGGLIVTGASFGYVLWSKWRESRAPPMYSKELVEQVLIHFRRDMYFPCHDIYTHVNKVRRKLEQKGKSLKASLFENIELELVDNSAQFQSVIKKIEEKIYKKLNVADAKGFKRCCKLYENEPEIGSLLREIRENLDVSVKGVAPTNYALVPEHVTKDLTLAILRKVSEKFEREWLGIVERYLKEGKEACDTNPLFVDEITDVSNEGAKEPIYKEYGISDFPDYPDMIFHKALDKYTKDGDPEFMKELSEIDVRRNLIFEAVMEGTVSIEGIRKLREGLDVFSSLKEEENPEDEGDWQDEAEEGGNREKRRRLFIPPNQ